MILNHNINHFKCLIRQSWFTKNSNDRDVYHNAYAFAVQSIAGKILTFHIMTDYGMLRSRVPISEIFLKECKNDIDFHMKQLWDCFSENVSVTEYDYLAGKRCQVLLKNKSLIWATYMFTVDWYNNPYSDEPSDYKCGHVLVSDDGYLLCQPNNRIYWKDMNWVTKEFPIDKQLIKVDEEILSVETSSDKYISQDSNSFYYEVKKKQLDNTNYRSFITSIYD